MIKRCLYCRNIIFPTVAHYTKRVTCSKGCSNAYRWTIPKWRKEHIEKFTNFIRGKFAGRRHTEETLKNRKTPKGIEHYNWKGNNVKKHTGRIRAQRMYPKMPCEKCFTIKGVQRHHIDKNTLNNSRENIMFLCPKHHIPLYHIKV